MVRRVNSRGRRLIFNGLLLTLISACSIQTPAIHSLPEEVKPTIQSTQAAQVQLTSLIPTETNLPVPAGSKSPFSPAPEITLQALTRPDNPIPAENSQPGSTGWLAGMPTLSHDIAGFADSPSVNVGETLQLAVSTRVDGTLYSVKVFRLGWYGGRGGREVFHDANLHGQAQGTWDPTIGSLDGCTSCTWDAQTGMLDTHWTYNYALHIPSNWLSGEYEIILTDANYRSAYVSFVVRQDQRTSDILFIKPVNTYQAYNKWGGYSLYTSPAHGNGIPGYGLKPAVNVSFNRPYNVDDPFRLSNDIQALHFFERYGYDVSYATSVDLDRDPTLLKNHKALVSVGHDEYWTKTMFDAVIQARDAGLDLAFFGGNDIYGQTRLEPDQAGDPRRVMVMYRDANLDPLARTDPGNTSVNFAEPPVNRPQNQLTGTVFGGVIEHPLGVPWVVADTAPSWILNGTGLTPGDEIAGLTGKECDSISDNGFQPKGLIVIAASPMTTKENQPIVCNSTLYQADSGAYVFNAGTLSWTNALDEFGDHNPGVTANPHIIRLVQNVLALFGISPATLQP